MPTTYTHDLFGKRIYRYIPEEIQQVLRSHKDLYRIGLHGPDILFYYMVSKNRISQLGVRMHRTQARAFFEESMKKVRETGDEALLAYMIGFGCHYLLDSECHPYVGEMDSSGVISHTMLEKEFDRQLMLETGRDPLTFRPSDCIVPTYDYAKVIHKVITEVGVTNIFISLKMMKRLTNKMVCNDGGKRRRRIYRLLRFAGKNNADQLIEHFMLPEPPEGCEIPLKQLRKHFDKALQDAPQYLTELFDLSRTEKGLSERWNLTYNG